MPFHELHLRKQNFLLKTRRFFWRPNIASSRMGRCGFFLVVNSSSSKLDKIDWLKNIKMLLLLSEFLLPKSCYLRLLERNYETLFNPRAR